MNKDITLVRVIWLKGYPGHVSFAGLKSSVDASLAPKLFKDGFIQLLPDEQEESVNTLPEDLPARDKLFAAGFTTIDQVKEAGDSLLDAGISNTTLKKIKSYLV